MPDKPSRRRGSKGAPTHTFVRNGIQWARFQVGGREFRGSLSTRDERLARKRAEEWYQREVGIAKFGEDRKSYVDVFAAWSLHIVDQVGEQTRRRYAVSLRQLEPWLKPAFFDEIDRSEERRVGKEC